MTNASSSCCGPDPSSDLLAQLTPDLFRSLADPVRLQVVARLALASEPLTVSDVQSCCGVHLSGVSRHLKQLREAGVVEATKVGREVRYQLGRVELVARLRSLADLIESSDPCCERGPENSCC
ncbi:MAG: metalloregulator ArsR/SmtB family transcription factor [Planctomycetota bacterium]|nr:metalloregulator ArsR/SmtB family transcription factor [Planctomycetota bacterium]